MKEYWHRPEATADTVVDGWLLTGDVGYRDADGFYFVHDRIKDMIVSGGENVYPAEVESVIYSHPAVADAAVIGVPNADGEEVPKAYVVKQSGAELTEAEVIEFVAGQVAPYKKVRQVQFIDAVPKSASGKILRKDLKNA
jgi:acyl-CoA synthetase (AMP-forming)/AMP-acid ligase II